MTPRHRRASAAALALLVLSASAGCSAGTRAEGGRVAWPAGLPDADPVTCPPVGVPVATAGQLSAALATARPGDVIGLADGVYEGEFTADADGTERAPVWVCGSDGAVLTGPGTDEGTVLHLDGAEHWRLLGFTVTRGQKGVVADGVRASVLQDLTVTRIGDEAVHLRSGSSRNVVRGLSISDTGRREARFGEGVYVGTAESNWCEVTDCEPDRSDANVITGNTIRGTTAEAVDVKEGTTGGVVHDNDLDGAGMAGDTDSWIDVKGNGWLVQDNRGTASERSGFEVQSVLDGWGEGNTFDANTADVHGPGYGIDVRDGVDVRITCTNTATGADEGLSPVECS